MTRGSKTPLVPPIEDRESALHKKTDKNTRVKETAKKSSFKDLKSVFGKKSGKKVGESSTSSKEKSKIESFEQDPNPKESKYESDPEFELHRSDSEDEPENEMANIADMSMGAYKIQIEMMLVRG